MSKPEKQQIPRFSVSDRWQHWLLVFSFTLLALTGLVQKFSSSALSQSLIGLMGGIEMVRVIHRFAAIVLMLEAVYHIGVIAYGLVVRRVVSKMVPSMQDLRDAWGALLFSLGRRKERPKFDRYSFEEKFEYWAVIWGMAVMIITGFMLWNPIATTRLLPGEAIPAAKSAHGNEALLAVLAIIIWHFYNVLVRHFNRSMFTGKLSRHEMEEYHPLELEELEAPKGPPRELASEVEKRRRVFLPVYGLISVLLILGIYLFVTFEETALETIEPTERLEEVTRIQPTVVVDENALSSAGELVAPLSLMWPESAHTNSAARAFRHWDEDGEVPAACSQCHSELGLASYIAAGDPGSQPLSQGLSCDSCHINTQDYTLRSPGSLEFPSGALVVNAQAKISLCATCHMGRASAASVRGLGELEDADVVNSAISMVNLHSPSPAGSFFGAGAEMVFTYEGRDYAGQNGHVEDYDTCAECHQAHEFVPQAETCGECHSAVEASGVVNSVRFRRDDFDGDGDTEESLASEIDGLQAALLAAMQTYALENSGAALAYDAAHFPYYFADLNANNLVDGDELDSANAFAAFTPRLARAAFNLHFTEIDRGAYAHNPDFTIQILYDSLEDLGAEMSVYLRP